MKVPIRAPINPKAIEAKHPIPFLPAILAPIAPARDAMKSSNKNEKIFIYCASIKETDDTHLKEDCMESHGKLL